jgi:SAM-dependent methyltransferase
MFYDPGFLIHCAQSKQIKRYAEKFDGLILDFGCGSKPYESLFVNKIEYIGLDTNSSEHNHEQSNIDIIYDGLEIPFTSNYFDNIVLFDVIEHLENPDKSIDEIFRVLKPGGFVMGTVPFNFPLHESPQDFRRYSVYGLDKYLMEHGFAKVQNEKVLCGYASLVQTFISSHFEGGKKKSQLFKRITLSPFLLTLNLFGLFLTLLKKPNSIYTSNYFIYEKRLK